MQVSESQVFKALRLIGLTVLGGYLLVLLSFIGAFGFRGNPTASNPTESGTPQAMSVEKLQVVTSVQVWADIAQAIGGKYVTARAIISDPTRDPHSYEATVRDQLAVNRADLTIANGADYDPFFLRLVSKRPDMKIDQANGRSLILAKSATPIHNAAVNPHFWYDLRQVSQLAIEIAEREAGLVSDPAAKRAIRANAAAYQQRLDGLIKLQYSVAKTAVGKSVIYTEGFAERMLRNLALVDQTPREFLNAVEEEQDASPKVMNLMHELIKTHRVDLLVINSQTEGAQTAQLQKWATEAKVPVLPLSELLPTHTSYLHWMESDLNAIEGALR